MKWGSPTDFLRVFLKAEVGVTPESAEFGGEGEACMDSELGSAMS